MTQANDQAPTVQSQAGKLLTQIAGYVAMRTMLIGVQSGLLEEIGKHGDGITAESLARVTRMDPLYVKVWTNSAYAAELLEVGADETFTVAPHMANLLLNRDFPAYVGGIPVVLDSPEVFGKFAERMSSGQRTWWDECSHEFIQGVSGTGRPFYTRLIPNGLSLVPGLVEKLERGAAVAELASGAGVGLVRMAHTYTKCTLVGVDGDRYSVEATRQRIADHGIADRVTLQQSTLENWTPSPQFDMVFINISMHECRDIEKVTGNVKQALKPGGHFVISDLPFPASLDGLRTVPARVMSGIQFFEAQIDDQLMPTSDYVDLLNRHGFRDVGAHDITPVHNLIFGTK